MRNAQSPLASHCPTRFLRQVLLGAAFLGVVAVVSLPAARAAGPMGWMPMWLLGMPLVALAALDLADRRERWSAERGAPVQGAAAPRRVRPLQARRRPARRQAPTRRREQAPAAA